MRLLYSQQENLHNIGTLIVYRFVSSGLLCTTILQLNFKCIMLQRAFSKNNGLLPKLYFKRIELTVNV